MFGSSHTGKSTYQDLLRFDLAPMKSGVGRSKIGLDGTAGSNQLLIPAETPLQEWSEIVVYTKSSFAEQTTPVSFTTHCN